MISDEYERNSNEKASKFLKQPRTLSLAIVPGEHILSIALAQDKPPITTPSNTSQQDTDKVTTNTE